MKKILILGSNGFIGKSFIEYLVSKYKEEFNVIKADYNSIIDGNDDEMKVDLLEYCEFRDLIKEVKPHYIFNSTGKYGQGTLRDHVLYNFLIAVNLFDALIELNYRPQNILLIGSAAEYGDSKDLPLNEQSGFQYINNYGYSKYLQTTLANYASKYDININIARTFNLIGPSISRNLSVGAFIEKVKKANSHDTITVGNLNSCRDFLDIEDASRAYLAILLSGRPGLSYNVCSGSKIKMREVLQTIIDISGKKLKIQSEDITNQEIDMSYGDYSLLNSHCNWKPEVSVQESLKTAYTRFIL